MLEDARYEPMVGRHEGGNSLRQIFKSIMLGNGRTQEVASISLRGEVYMNASRIMHVRYRPAPLAKTIIQSKISEAWALLAVVPRGWRLAHTLR